MELQSIGSISSFGSVEPGRAFLFERHAKTLIGIKCLSGDAPGVIVLEEETIPFGTVGRLPTDPVIYLQDAKLVLPASSKSFEFERNGAYRPGKIYLFSDGRAYLCFRNDDSSWKGALLVNLADGTIVDLQSMAVIASITVSGWELSVPLGDAQVSLYRDR